MTFEFFPRLSQNFYQLLIDADDYNVIIKVGKNPNTKEFRAHSNILKARSPYFKSSGTSRSKFWSRLSQSLDPSQSA